MKKANPKAVWVAQAWQANPRQKMIENLPAGDLIVLDLLPRAVLNGVILSLPGIVRKVSASMTGFTVCC